MLISFLFLHENIWCGYPQHMFSWRNKKILYEYPLLSVAMTYQQRRPRSAYLYIHSLIWAVYSYYAPFICLQKTGILDSSPYQNVQKAREICYFTVDMHIKAFPLIGLKWISSQIFTSRFFSKLADDKFVILYFSKKTGLSCYVTSPIYI